MCFTSTIVLSILVRQIEGMKSINQVELEKLIEWIAPRVDGAQLQEVYSHERGLVLGLYLQKTFWLILDLENQRPFIALIQSEKSSWLKTKITRPAGLFLNSHGKNLYLCKIAVRPEFGRAVEISFQNKNKSCDLEMHLVPRRSNLRISAEGKTISWLPWKALEAKYDMDEGDMKGLRGPETLLQEWFDAEQKPNVNMKRGTHPLEGIKKDLKKKLKATQEISNKILQNEDEAKKLYLLGEELKMKSLENFKNTSQEIFLDFKKSTTWNREKCFEKAKSNLKKNEGAKLRLEKLKLEIDVLESKISRIEGGEIIAEPFSSENFQQGQRKKHKISDSEESVRSRKKTLPSGVVVFMGKSAKDNLALLRRARAWDFWLHLRDYPGAHAIIHREKNQNLNPKELQEVSRWLAEESLGSKGLQNGARLNVIMAEVRFVRPIKGDATGKVNYHSEKNFNFHYEKSS